MLYVFIYVIYIPPLFLQIMQRIFCLPFPPQKPLCEVCWTERGPGPSQDVADVTDIPALRNLSSQLVSWLNAIQYVLNACKDTSIKGNCHPGLLTSQMY